MKRLFLTGLAGVSCLAVLVLASPARALRIAPAPIPMRVATADLAVVGKVTGFGPKMVKMNGADHQIALVDVSESILGKAGKQIKVAFVPPMAAGPGRPIRPGFRRFGVNLTIGMEGCFLLTKAPTAGYYTVGNPDNVFIRPAGDAAGFGMQVEEVRKAARILANPKAGLKSADAAERLTTAAVLISRYRTQRVFTPMAKTAPIDAEESKLILQTLANAEWKAAPGPRFNFMMNPQNLFFRLGLTPADGWVQPKDFRNLEVEAKKWLKANAGTYRIQRFTNEPAPKS
jgi:hypothetical protein